MRIDLFRITCIAKDLLHGGLADNIPSSQLDPQELQKGIEVEREHVDNPALQKEIAKDHLVEIPDYYSRLLLMEDKAKQDKTK